MSTHSFRKYFATQMYVNNNYDIVLVKELLQHGSVKTTQDYISLNRETVEKALREHIHII
ncbi:tyrosine-type recombinase/integrase [Sarcina ventriculi]|uniref:tyrosine-type recombinase/integrase n=1 Tax=Sarcina ventriculi TaxID=1267 RepID=UPI0038B5D52A